MLDRKNEILFEHLLSNARFSVKQLARVIHSSKPAVIKRIKNLEEKGYISRYDAIINWQKLPLLKKIYHLKLNEKNEEQVIKQLIAQQPVFSIIRLAGLFNLQVWCFFKNREQQNLFEKQIECEKISMEIRILEFPTTSFFNHPIKIDMPKIQDRIIGLKKIDVLIMKYLAQGNGRMSLLEMSRKLNLPYDSVNYHAKNLIKAGYFSKMVAQPGESQFTLQTNVLIIRFKQKVAIDFYKRLLNVNQIRSIALTKDNRIVIHFFSQNFQDYQNKLNEILSKDREKIKDVSISQWTKVILNNRYPLDYLVD
jgi:Lrp/AsnC family transcriptional regulator, leucine-responsive regulatory protein